MAETKEFEIAGKKFVLKKERSFKKQCELEKLGLKGLPVYGDDLIKADCLILGIDNSSGKSIQKFIEVTDEDLDNITESEGRKLFQELIYFQSPELKKGKKKLFKYSKKELEEQARLPEWGIKDLLCRRYGWTLQEVEELDLSVVLILYHRIKWLNQIKNQKEDNKSMELWATLKGKEMVRERKK